MGKKRTKAPKIELHPMFRWIQDPVIRQYYVQMAKQRTRSRQRSQVHDGELPKRDVMTPLDISHLRLVIPRLRNHPP